MDNFVNLTRKCPLCQNHTASLLYSQDLFLLADHKLSNHIDIVECDKCFFVFTDSDASKEDYEAYYATSDKYKLKNFFNLYETEQAKRQVKLIESKLDKDSKILEIGSGSGCLMHALYLKDYRNLFAVDPSYDTKQNVTEFEIKRASIGSIPYTGKKKFDLIIMSHVIEHIYDLNTMIEEVKVLLKPEGLLLIELPNAGQYDQFIEAPFQDFNLEHINHFTSNSLKVLFETNNFKTCNLDELIVNIAKERFLSVILALFQISDKSEANIKPISYRKNFDNYIKKSKHYLEQIKEHLKKELAEEKKVLVWGIGQLFYKLCNENIIPKEKIEALIDSNFKEDEIDNKTQLKTMSPSSLKQTNSTILIASTISKDSIIKSIVDRKLENKIITLPDLKSE